MKSIIGFQFKVLLLKLRGQQLIVLVDVNQAFIVGGGAKLSSPGHFYGVGGHQSLQIVQG